MKLYVCYDHDTHYVCGGSVILARDEEEARALLDAELVRGRLRPFSEVPYTLKRMSQGKADVVFHVDGEY